MLRQVRCKHFCCREGLEKRPKAIRVTKGAGAIGASTMLGAKLAEKGSSGPGNIGWQALPYNRHSSLMPKGVRVDEGSGCSLPQPKPDLPLSTEITRLKRLHEAHGGEIGSKVRRISAMPLFPPGKPAGESASRKIYGERSSDDDDGLPTLERLLREGASYRWCPETMTSRPKKGILQRPIGKNTGTERDGVRSVQKNESRVEPARIEQIPAAHEAHRKGSLVLDGSKPKDQIFDSKGRTPYVPIFSMNKPLDEPAVERDETPNVGHVAKHEGTVLYEDVKACDVKQEHKVAVPPSTGVHVGRTKQEEIKQEGHDLIQQSTPTPTIRVKHESKTEYSKGQRLKSEDDEDLDYIVMFASQGSIKKEVEIKGEGTEETLQGSNLFEDFVIYV